MRWTSTCTTASTPLTGWTARPISISATCATAPGPTIWMCAASCRPRGWPRHWSSARVRSTATSATGSAPATCSPIPMAGSGCWMVRMWARCWASAWVDRRHCRAIAQRTRWTSVATAAQSTSGSPPIWARAGASIWLAAMSAIRISAARLPAGFRPALLCTHGLPCAARSATAFRPPLWPRRPTATPPMAISTPTTSCRPARRRPLPWARSHCARKPRAASAWGSWPSRGRARR
ncbi:hypothetical protein D3C71_1388950 [compost metagenome]